MSIDLVGQAGTFRSRIDTKKTGENVKEKNLTAQTDTATGISYTKQNNTYTLLNADKVPAEKIAQFMQDKANDIHNGGATFQVIDKDNKKISMTVTAAIKSDKKAEMGKASDKLNKGLEDYHNATTKAEKDNSRTLIKQGNAEYDMIHNAIDSYNYEFSDIQEETTAQPTDPNGDNTTVKSEQESIDTNKDQVQKDTTKTDDTITPFTNKVTSSVRTDKKRLNEAKEKTATTMQELKKKDPSIEFKVLKGTYGTWIGFQKDGKQYLIGHNGQVFAKDTKPHNGKYYYSGKTDVATLYPEKDPVAEKKLEFTQVVDSALRSTDTPATYNNNLFSTDTVDTKFNIGKDNAAMIMKDPTQKTLFEQTIKNHYQTKFGISDVNITLNANGDVEVSMPVTSFSDIKDWHMGIPKDTYTQNGNTITLTKDTLVYINGELKLCPKNTIFTRGVDEKGSMMKITEKFNNKNIRYITYEHEEIKTEVKGPLYAANDNAVSA